MDSLMQQVKHLRKIKGWTQENLARRVGVTLNTVQRWEMGKTKPSPLAVEKLQNLLKEAYEGEQLKLLWPEKFMDHGTWTMGRS